jgi:hypothetical protein
MHKYLSVIVNLLNMGAVKHTIGSKIFSIPFFSHASPSLLESGREI